MDMTKEHMMSQMIKLTSVFALTTVLAFLGFVSSAFAADTDLELKFRKLEAQTERGALVINYKINKKSWKDVRKAGITPQLSIYTAARNGEPDFRYSVALSSQKGSFTFPKSLKIRHFNELEVRVTGFNGFYQIEHITFGERCADSLRIAISHPSHHGHGGRDYNRPRKTPKRTKVVRNDGASFTAALVQACKNNVSSFESSKCIAKANKIDTKHAIAVVNACGTYTEWDSDFRKCMDKSLLFGRVNPAPAVNACGKATEWSSELLTCLDRSAKYGYQASKTVQACDAHTEWNSDFNKCIDGSRTLGRNGHLVVNACGQGADWASELHQCIRDSRRQ